VKDQLDSLESWINRKTDSELESQITSCSISSLRFYNVTRTCAICCSDTECVTVDQTNVPAVTLQLKNWVRLQRSI